VKSNLCVPTICVRVHYVSTSILYFPHDTPPKHMREMQTAKEPNTSANNPPTCIRTSPLSLQKDPTYPHKCAGRKTAKDLQKSAKEPPTYPHKSRAFLKYDNTGSCGDVPCCRLSEISPQKRPTYPQKKRRLQLKMH